MSSNHFRHVLVYCVISTCCRFGLHTCVGDYSLFVRVNFLSSWWVGGFPFTFGVLGFSFAILAQVGGWEGSPLRSAC